MDKNILIYYLNWRGQLAWRQISPKRLEFTKTDWHKDSQWILFAYDLQKRAQRSFAVKDIICWVEHTR